MDVYGKKVEMRRVFKYLGTDFREGEGVWGAFCFFREPCYVARSCIQKRASRNLVEVAVVCTQGDVWHAANVWGVGCDYADLLLFFFPGNPCFKIEAAKLSEITHVAPPPTGSRLGCCGYRPQASV